MADVYEIRTPADFLKVPVDRLPLCLSEFAYWLIVRECEAAIPEATFVTDVFHWFDDDDGEVTIGIFSSSTGATLFSSTVKITASE